MALAQGTMFTDQTVVGIAQTSIQKALNVSTGTVIWLTNAFFLGMSIFIGIGGRMGDFFQHKRVFLSGIVIFCLASLSAAVASDIFALLISRFIQGIGMAMVIPNAVVILIRSFPKEEKGKAMGMFLGLSFFILPIGLFTSTGLMEQRGWHIIFWQDLLMAVLSGVIAYFAIGEKLSVSQKFILNWQGLLTYMIGITSLVYLAMQYPYLNWSSIFLFGLLAVLFLFLCYYVEKKHRYPIIDFNLFKNKLFLCAILLGFSITTTISLYAFDTFYYQQVLGYSPLATSMLFIPNILCQIISAPIGGLIYDKYGFQRSVLLGFTFAISGLLINAWIGYFHVYWFLIPGILAINIGTPFITTSARTLAITSVHTEEQGVASGIYNIFDILGGTVTLALLTLVVVSIFRYLLNNFLQKFHKIYSFLSLDDFEKILSQPQTIQHLKAPQFNQVIESAKFSFTVAYSMGLLFCAIVLMMGLTYFLVLLKERHAENS